MENREYDRYIKSKIKLLDNNKMQPSKQKLSEKDERRREVELLYLKAEKENF